MTTHRFDVVRHRGTKNLPCPSCGKKVRRSTTVEHTVNPFNRNDSGAVKTHVEVRADAIAEVDAWRAESVLCAACQP